MEESDEDIQDKLDNELYIIEEEEEEERKKLEEEEVKPKVNKTSDMKLYMRKYMSEYNYTRKLTVDYCEICDAYISYANKYKHKETKMHKYLQGQKEGYTECEYCDMKVLNRNKEKHKMWSVHIMNVERSNKKDTGDTGEINRANIDKHVLEIKKKSEMLYPQLLKMKEALAVIYT
jgi:hypothetical protein